MIKAEPTATTAIEWMLLILISVFYLSCGGFIHSIVSVPSAHVSLTAVCDSE